MRSGLQPEATTSARPNAHDVQVTREVLVGWTFFMVEPNPRGNRAKDRAGERGEKRGDINCSLARDPMSNLQRSACDIIGEGVRGLDRSIRQT